MFSFGDKKFIIEFDGVQHFRFVPFWQKSEARFLFWQEIDRLKNHAAMISGFNVIRISKKVLDDTRAFILYCLHKLSDGVFLEVDDEKSYECQTAIKVSDETIKKYIRSF